MKPFPLLSVLRHTLRVWEWLTAIAAAFVLLTGWIISPLMASTPGFHVLSSGPLYHFAFTLPDADRPVPFGGVSGTQEAITVRNFTADVFIASGDSSSPLIKWLRWRSASAALLLALACALASCLRLLCDQVRQGNAFSTSSVRLLRRFAWCCFGYVVGAALLNGAVDYGIAETLRAHVRFETLHTTFATADLGGGINFWIRGVHLKLDISKLAFGFFALVLSEVFRQGVLLREDSELTV